MGAVPRLSAPALASPPTWSPQNAQEKWSSSPLGRNFNNAWGQTSAHGRGNPVEVRGMPNEFRYRWDAALRESAAVSLTAKAGFDLRSHAAGPAVSPLTSAQPTTRRRLPNGQLQSHHHNFGIRASHSRASADACKPVRAFWSTPLAIAGSKRSSDATDSNDRMTYGQEVMG